MNAYDYVTNNFLSETSFKYQAISFNAQTATVNI